jgi:hypothetical protein
MYRLPISGLQVLVREPTGAEDLLLQEARDLDVNLALQLFSRLVRSPDVSETDWRSLSVTDHESLLLMLRRATLGDLVRAETKCGAPNCGARADVSFRIGAYLASLKSHLPRGVVKSGENGWYQFVGDNVKFRLPTGEDLVALSSGSNREQELVRRCVKPAKISARVRRRVERAMETLAPALSKTLQGTCPECKAEMNSYFEVRPFVLRELRDHASLVFEDVHLLAFYYKWPEADILGLPSNRRSLYAEALRNQRSAA